MELIKEKDRIVLYVDGNEIGEITWFEENNKLIVDHTFVDPAYRGNNYARILVDEVVKFARSENKKIVPVCPYVDKVLSRDDNAKDILENDENYGKGCKIR